MLIALAIVIINMYVKRSPSQVRDDVIVPTGDKLMPVVQQHPQVWIVELGYELHGLPDIIQKIGLICVSRLDDDGNGMAPGKSGDFPDAFRQPVQAIRLRLPEESMARADADDF